MAYHFKAKESVPEGVRRIVCEEAESATNGLLHAKGRKRDEAVHEARKSIKKIRGVLRMVQPELGSTYGQENAKLREVGHHLSEIRDAEAVQEVFNDLVTKYRAQLKPEAVRAVRRGLTKNKQETLKRLKVDATVRTAITALRAIGKGVDNWPLKNEGFDALSDGFRLRYGRGRKAMALAAKQPTAENYHNWRKRAKDHWYHVRLMEDLWTDILKAREAALKDLETWLGDDHNLVVLREKFKSEPDLYGGALNVAVFTSLMDEYSRELREKSLALGSKLYEQKPKALAREMGRLWNAWKNSPALKKPAAKQAASKAVTTSAA